MTARIILILAFLSIIVLWLCVGFLRWELTKQRDLIEKLKAGKFEEAINRHLNTEQRCQHCREKNECLAYDSGVIYPCRSFVEEENDGAEE